MARRPRGRGGRGARREDCLRALVTGGAGFIGSHLADRLLAEGHEVTLLDAIAQRVHPRGDPPAYLDPRARLVRGDVRDLAAVAPLVREADVVFHLAAWIAVAQSQYEIRSTVDVNLTGTATLLQAMADAPQRPRRFVVAGSMSAYGDGAYDCARDGVVYPGLRAEAALALAEWEPRCPACGGPVAPRPTPEEAPLRGPTVYAITKRAQEDLAFSFGRSYGVETVALRFFNAYGPRQSLGNPYNGVAAIFLSRLKNGRAPVIYEDGLQTRDFVSVHDVAAALSLAAGHPAAPGEVFNIGSGRRVTIRDVAATLASLAGRAIEPEIEGGRRKGDVRHCGADIGKARRLLGWKPRVEWRAGMAELVAWSETAEAADLFDPMAAEMRRRGLA